VEGGAATPFTSYALAPSADPLWTVKDIVPQYYEYAGYVATATETAHKPSDAQTGPILLDVDASDEYWVTVYIKPMAAAPGDYTWDSHSNEFGQIFAK
jgi:hypothetical protein